MILTQENQKCLRFTSLGLITGSDSGRVFLCRDGLSVARNGGGGGGAKFLISSLPSLSIDCTSK